MRYHRAPYGPAIRRSLGALRHVTETLHRERRLACPVMSRDGDETGERRQASVTYDGIRCRTIADMDRSTGGVGGAINGTNPIQT